MSNPLSMRVEELIRAASSTTKQIPCPHCGGTREVRVIVCDEECMAPCDECDGGWVTVRISRPVAIPKEGAA